MYRGMSWSICEIYFTFPEQCIEQFISFHWLTRKRRISPLRNMTKYFPVNNVHQTYCPLERI